MEFSKDYVSPTYTKDVAATKDTDDTSISETNFFKTCNKLLNFDKPKPDVGDVNDRRSENVTDFKRNSTEEEHENNESRHFI